MKFVLPAALLVAVSLAGYAAMGGPGMAQQPAGPVPWHNPDKADHVVARQGLPSDDPAWVAEQWRLFFQGLRGPKQIPASWNSDPLYAEWYVSIEDPAFPVGHPLRNRLKKVNDPF